MESGRYSDTIAAIATAVSNSGIGIIRISGSKAIVVADRIFESIKEGKKLQDVPTHTIHYGMVKDGNQILDEVLVTVMRGPHSYTGEDTVEINCHGGVLVMKRILETVIRSGAVAAEPGEFTKRAFLNGRMDLSQAEAVMDVIAAKNDYAMANSVSQLKGSVSRKIKKLREALLYQVAYIESALDDPEHISLDGYTRELRKALEEIVPEIEGLLKNADNGRLISEGIRTVILGKPNAGKSSLMNILVGQERAIVTDVAGTTRDILEEQIRIGDVSLRLTDTAGIRETEDVVEKIGVLRAKEAAKEADLIIYVVDGACPLDGNDREIIEMLKSKRAIILLNKVDLNLVVEEKELEKMTGHPVIEISAKEEIGIERLEKEISYLFFHGKLDFNDELVITNIRHKNALEAALGSLRLVFQGMKDGMPEDFLTIDLMDAYGKLGLIVGEAVEDDLVNEIFGKFCMGK
ncbi:tRNA uridine-5-carboxymethylaminomethyl(34) synthesis GTPase MnmE [Clostridiaceae bacterium]|nr:tRNA uridine-5-carboxymethylaminomethyl(34) synthesis GTPase MnmE [Clostridiaceae bacterium]RKI16002.1 tRNA uridine-5-carboxymethylaminomethyl(34) synthesis GTPase MnmE [bacterium 1XD21-70]